MYFVVTIFQVVNSKITSINYTKKKIIFFKNFAITFLINNKIDNDFKNYARVYNIFMSKTHFDLKGDFLYECFVTSRKLRVVTALFTF